MDTIETIILTSIVNIIITGLVGGIVIYRIQKNIDATIQKSLFEYQTKFSINHAKSVATLETLYKKFMKFSGEFNTLSYKLSMWYSESPKTELGINSSDCENNKMKLDEFEQYLMENRLYLSADIFFELERIHTKSWNIATVFSVMLPTSVFPPEIQKLMIEKLLDETVLDKSTMNQDKLDFEYLLAKMDDAIGGHAEKLESLYKSIAETEY